MITIPLEDYTTEVYLDEERDPVIIREVTPKDFYLAAALQDQGGSMDPLLHNLVVNQDVLENYTAREFRQIMVWTRENIIDGSLMEISDWMKMALVLMDGAWDQSLDWLETQPFSKIQSFVDATVEYRKKNPKLA